MPAEDRGPGALIWFSAQGMLGLMFLKAYLILSDEGQAQKNSVGSYHIPDNAEMNTARINRIIQAVSSPLRIAM